MDGLPPRVRDVLGEHQTLVLATVDGNGQPEAASVFFASDEAEGGLTLVVACLSSSAKLAHLRENPRAGVYIGPQTPSRWVQAECLVTIVEDEAERSRRLAQLTAATPAAAVFVERVPVTAVLFRVTRLKLTDLTGGQPPVEVVELE
ncbi:MAG: pyridoxamine 5'-phosphate oxidase family protein [Dehalococcoidia bacterium]